MLLEYTLDGFSFAWDWETDSASLTTLAAGDTVWSGSLLPTFEVAESGGRSFFAKPEIGGCKQDGTAWILELKFASQVEWKGCLEVVIEGPMIRFRRLELLAQGARLKGMFFGMSPLPEDRLAATPVAGAEFWPDWRAEGFCVPGAKCNPGQSFWRAWDMGHAVLPLGNFGPAMGIPYTAAFPRPLYAAAMGGKDGWLVFGPGKIPASALSLDIQALSARLRFWMREDLWGAPAGEMRVWEDPLRLAWHKEAWDGFARLFDTFPVHAVPLQDAQRSQWGTWGNFKQGRFDMDSEIARAGRYGVEDLQIDDYWETWMGSGCVHRGRLPDLEADCARARQAGLRIDLWLSLGWVAKPEEIGLGPEDLLCGPDGKPRLANWAIDPRTDQALHYCLDPGSEKTRNFLRQRVEQIVKTLDPDLLKLDFAYGMPGPDASAPRNPEHRGERVGYELLRLTVEAARAVKPGIAIEYYGIHPLMRPLTDLISLDDLGDFGPTEEEGHGQRSVWAALAASQRVGIMASSGYYWSAFSEMLLNAAVLGSPGACLSETDATGNRETPALICRFRALARWHRRTVGWKPVWLNSRKGDIKNEPLPLCWGRDETGAGEPAALALRDSDSAFEWPRNFGGVEEWSGRWALISLDEPSLPHCQKLVCIPFSEGHLKLRKGGCILRVEYCNGQESETLISDQQVDLIIVHDPEELDSLMGFVIQR